MSRLARILYFLYFILIYSDANCDRLPDTTNNTAISLLSTLGKLAQSELSPRLRFPLRGEDDPTQSIQAEGYDDDSNPRQEHYARPTLPPSENPELLYGENYYRPQPGNYQRPVKKPNRYPQKKPNRYPGPPRPYYEDHDYERPYPPNRYQKPQRPPFGYPPNRFQDLNYPPPDRYQDPQAPYPGPYPFDGPYPGFDPQQPYPGQGPLSSLGYALQSIARYDDQKCVPRLLCEVAAGGNPSTRQTSSLLPSFDTMESLFTLLTAFGGDQISPFFTFGRAALLGISSQGKPSSCRYAYPECPRDPDELVDYLNNHNGGFFRFFNGINGGQNQDPQQVQQEQQQDLSQQPQQQFNIGQLTQLLGRPPNYFNYRRPINNRYYNRYGYYNPQDYPYYGRHNGNHTNDTEARIQNKPIRALDNFNDQPVSLNYPQGDRHPEGGWIFPGNSAEGNYYGLNTIPNGNGIDAAKFKFPEYDNDRRKPKALFFPQESIGQVDQNLYFPTPLPYYDHSKMIFPDRTGTGNLKFDSDKLLNSYSTNNNYNYYNQNNYQQNYSPRPVRDQSGSGSKKKNLVYIVRGNGDPSKPEIVDLGEVY